MVFFKERWYLLPVFSALLLLFSMYPFPLWPLGFIALVPIFYATAAYSHYSWQRVFRSGFIAGALLIFALYYLTLYQFHWLPSADGLVFLVRLGIIPATLLGGALLGSGLCLYRFLRSKHILLNALLGGLAYMLLELTFDLIFQGYYTGVLAYTMTSVAILMHLAALGGASLVSFVIAVCAALVAETLVAWPLSKPRFLQAGLFAVLLLGVIVANEHAMRAPAFQEVLSVAILQPGSREQITFGTTTGRVFSFPEFSQTFDMSPLAQSDLIIYPFSFAQGALYSGEKPSVPVPLVETSSVGKWVEQTFPPEATVVSWDIVHEEDSFYSTFDFWERGRVVGEYRKRALHLLDAPSAQADKFNLYEKALTLASGTQVQPLPTLAQGVQVSSLICSELMRDDTALLRESGSLVLLSMGSEEGFIDDTLSTLSLRAARYRAVEYGVSVIRADVQGPSALVDRYGMVHAYAPSGVGTTLVGELHVEEPRATLYARFGSNPLYLLWFGALVLAMLIRFPRRMGQW